MTGDDERIVSLYQRHAAARDKERGKHLFEESWLDRFLALLPQGGTILDLGCGTGEPIARYFIEAGYRVTGADSSPTMIDFCQRRFPNEQWLVADIRQLSLGDRFGGILAWDSFFHLNHEDQIAMFPIFAAHAAPGAALMFTSGDKRGVAMGEFHGEPLYHASLDADEYRALLHDNEFAVVSHVSQDAACGGHTVWLAQCA